MMLSRSAVRVMQPLCAHARRYATESTPPNLRPSGGGGGGGNGGTAKRSSTNLLVIAASTFVAGGAAYFLLGGKPAPREAKGAPARVSTDAATSSLPPSPRAEGAGGGASARSALTGGDQGFVSLLLDKVDIVNHNTKKFTFKLPEEDMVSGLHVASAVLTRFQAPATEKAVIRPYTPISSEDTNGYLELLVKRYPDGPMSSHLHDMQPGQRLDFKGPLPKYPWTANQHGHVALIAGGTGITPMFQLARHILANPQDKTKITLVFGNVSEEDILLKPELDRLENTFPQRFRAFYVLDRPATSWPGGRGFINRELLQTVLPEPKQAGVKVFVCGPPGMMKAISGEKKSPREQGDLVGALKELGYTPDQVYKF